MGVRCTELRDGVGFACVVEYSVEMAVIALVSIYLPVNDQESLEIEPWV